MGDSQFIESDRAKIARQIRLPLSKAIEISAKSMKTRFWRSLITMSGIILAIAFLMFIVSSNAIIDELRSSDDPTLRIILQKKGYEVVEGEEEHKGAKETWLVSLSLFVAGVGIVNAMLMSVTERFREIGTMKCLGALNSFIVELFLLESAFQGAAGTVIGITLGFLLSFFTHWVSFGTSFFFAHFPGLTILGWAGGALGIGIGISVMGAVWPARVAAKMEPVVALRTEV